MRNTNLMMLAFTLLLVWGCKKEEDDTVAVNGVVSGTVTDANTNAALEGVRIIVFESDANAPVKSLTTGADGTYSTEILAGSYYLKLYRNGYNQVPPRGMMPVPFTVSVDKEIEKPYAMNPSAVQNGGFISGKVMEGSTGVAGVLVVAQSGNGAHSAITDAAGDYFIYNLPAADYTLKGWVAGYSSDQQTATVTASAEAKKNLQLTKGAAGSVTGSLSFLASSAVEVDVTLVHPGTGEAIPGLRTLTMKDYTLLNVPAGTYIARATYQNDERVVDPDWIVKNGEPEVTVASGSAVMDFSLTGSVLLSSPTNLPQTTEPMVITTATPEFSWQDYSSASDYVIEVSDANGNVIWGGFRDGLLGPEKVISLPSSQTKVVYNYDNSATSPLLPGRVYRWKVYASKDDKSTAGWSLISSSEDQMGLIQIAE